MQASMKRLALRRRPASWRPRRSPALLADTAYVTNEKGNSISVIDLDKLEVDEDRQVGQRPRGIALSKDERCSSSASATTIRSRSSTPRR